MFSIVGIVIIVMIAFWGVGQYNLLISMRRNVLTELSKIDIQLDKRWKLYKGIVNSIDKYMEHEKSTFLEVTKQRQAVKVAKDTNDEAARFRAEENLTKLINNIGTSLQVQVEKYPELKADKQVILFMEQMSVQEKELAESKGGYNEHAGEFNAMIERVPTVFIASFFKSKFREFHLWSLDAASRELKEEYIPE